ncbi:MAG: hypothetical protein RL458_2529, partial [Pseudomonadota bacterium]
MTRDSGRLGDLPLVAAQRFGASEAVVFGSERVSYQSLSAAVDECARGLIALGVQSGDRVLIYVPNCLRWLVAFYSLIAVGAVAVPVNTRFRRDDLAYLVRQSGASTLIISENVPGVDVMSMVHELLDCSGQDDLPRPTFPEMRRLISTSDASVRAATGWQALIEAGRTVSQQM